MNISGIEIGNGNPCRFVAEISNNHNGSLDRAFRLIEAAKASGADFVKFQAFTPDELIALRGDGPAPEPWGSQGWTMKSLYQKAQTPLAWFGELSAKCAEVGIPWFASVFGKESLMQMEYYGCPAYKIASFERDQSELKGRVAKTGKPMIISSPDSMRRHYKVLNLWCPPGYPQTDPYYTSELGFAGLSYHGTQLAWPLYAARHGAQLVEFHFHLRDEPSELESNVSIDEHQLKLLTATYHEQLSLAA